MEKPICIQTGKPCGFPCCGKCPIYSDEHLLNINERDVCRYCKSPNIVDNEPWTNCRDCGQSFI